MDANTLVAGCVFGVSIFLYTRLQPKNGNEDRAEAMPGDDKPSADISLNNSIADSNNWEILFQDEKRIRKVAANLLIKYDNNGLVEEVVRVENTDHYLEKSVFRGYCESRQVHDTFLYDFIRSCTDLDTGENVDDVQQYLFLKYDLSSEKTVDLISFQYSDLLKAFYCRMNNDGLLHDHGIECVRQYFCNLTGDDRLTAEQIETLFTELHPGSDDTFEQALTGIRQREAVDMEAFCSCCEEISGIMPVNNDEAVTSCRKE